MKLFRKIVFWSHLAVGAIAGVVILIMSATGVLLTYEKQIIAWADTRHYQITPEAGAVRLPIETLLAKVRVVEPDAKINAVTVRAEATEPTAIALAAASGAGSGRGRTLFVNPYTGAIFGEGAQGVRNFFRLVTDWHRWLGAQGASRATTRAITGACNLGFLFIVASGIYLWWPRKRNWAQFKNILWFKRGLPGKARDFNWHNVIGFWSFVPLFIVVLSATVISYTWASNLAYRVVGETPPAPPQRGSGGPSQDNAGAQRSAGENNSAAAPTVGLNQLWTRAEQQTTGWRSISLRVPASVAAPAVFTIDAGTGGEPQKRATLTLDQKTGAVERWEPFASFSKGRQLRSILRFAHTGEVAGLIGQTIAGLVSLGACFMVYTGLALSWRRFRVWKGSRTAALAPIAVPAMRASEQAGD